MTISRLTGGPPPVRQLEKSRNPDFRDPDLEPADQRVLQVRNRDSNSEMLLTLLNLDCGAGVDELLLDRLGFFLGNALFHGLRRTFN